MQNVLHPALPSSRARRDCAILSTEALVHQPVEAIGPWGTLSVIVAINDEESAVMTRKKYSRSILQITSPFRPPGSSAAWLISNIARPRGARCKKCIRDLATFEDGSGVMNSSQSNIKVHHQKSHET